MKPPHEIFLRAPLLITEQRCNWTYSLHKNRISCISECHWHPSVLHERTYCGGLEMAPHVNKWSPLDGTHE